jgi:hypothetical protein
MLVYIRGRRYPSTESNHSSSFASVATGRGGPFFKRGGSALRPVDVEVEGDTVVRIGVPPVRGTEGTLVGADEVGGVGEAAALALP